MTLRRVTACTHPCVRVNLARLEAVCQYTANTSAGRTIRRKGWYAREKQLRSVTDVRKHKDSCPIDVNSDVSVFATLKAATSLTGG